MHRTLFFDIDDTILAGDRPKPALCGGRLERIIKARFDRLVCASGWVDIFRNLPPYKLDVREQIWRRTAGEDAEHDDWPTEGYHHPLFPDKTWFVGNTGLVEWADFRCEDIDLDSDWYYIDDLAEQYFVKTWGQDLYQEHAFTRIFIPDPHGVGADVLDFIGRITPEQPT